MVASKEEMATSRAPVARRFYAKALSEAEKANLEEAMGVQGLDEEIALLRLRLQRAIEEYPDDLELMFKGAALLSRLVATKFGLSKGDTDALAAAIERAVAALSEMMPEGVPEGRDE